MHISQGAARKGTKFLVYLAVAAFILAVSTGWLLERLCTQKDRQKASMPTFPIDQAGPYGNDIYGKTQGILRSVLPYFLAAGVIGLAIEYLAPANFLTKLHISNNIGSIFVSILVGIPIYVCHGAEILLLRPLIHQSGFSEGAAIAFSLASTSICITSLVILIRFIGKRPTVILLILLISITFLEGLVIDAVN